MNIVRCDKCGKEIRAYDALFIKGEEKRKCLLKVGNYKQEIDVCPDCYDEILEKIGYEYTKRK